MRSTDLVRERNGANPMSNAGSFYDEPQWPRIDSVLHPQKQLKSLSCSLIQVYFPARFRETVHTGVDKPELRGLLVLRPLHFMMRMVLAPPDQRFRQPLKESDLARFDLTFNYPFLSICRRNPKKTEIKTWDVGNRRHWSLSGDEVVAALAVSFIYPDWMYPNWELVADPAQLERGGKRVLVGILRCLVANGQPIPGGVRKADELEVSFDLHTGLMVKRVAKLCGNVVEESRLVRVSSLAWDR